MKKYFFLLFLSILFFSLTSASTLTISPPHARFSLIKNQKKCENFSLGSDRNVFVEGKTLWEKPEKSNRILKEHKLNSSKVGITVYFQKDLELNKRSNQKICIKGNSSGNFHGVLLYKIKDQPLQVGMWLNVTIFESRKAQKASFSNVKLKANSIQQNSVVDGFEIFGIVEAVILILILFLFKKFFENKKTEFENK